MPTYESLDPINVFNIQKYGAVPGQLCDDAFTRALSAAARFSWAVLYIPGAAAPYYISRTIWITRSNLFMRGDGKGISTVAAVAGFNGHMIASAINTSVPGGIPTADHFVSLDGFGDGTLAGCRGVRLGTDQLLACWSGPFDQPMRYGQLVNRGWSDFPEFTLNLVLDDHGKPLPIGPFCGIGEISPHGYQARPFHLLKRDESWLEFRFATAESPESYRSFLIPDRSPSGAREISVQHSLITCKTQVFMNKVQVNAYPFVNVGPASSQTRTLSYTPADQLKLVENAYHPFMVGAYGSSSQSRGGGPPMDLTVCGLSLSTGILYADDGVDKPQRARDGSPVTDSSLARPNPQTLLASLAIGRIAATNPLGGREIPLNIGQACGRGGGYTSGLLSPNWYNSNCGGWLKNLTFQGFSLVGAGCYGDLLSLGGAWEVAVEDMSFDNGYCNIGSTRMGPSTYDVKLSDLNFGYSWGAGYFGHCMMADAHRFRFLQPIRNCITLVASNFSLKHSLINASINKYTIASYAEDNGGDLRFEDITIDNEGNLTPTDATFFVEVPYNERVSLTIDGVITGSTGPRSAIVQLKGIAGIAPRHYPVSIKNIKTDQTSVIVRTDHADISGELIADSANADKYPWLELTGGITTTNLTVRSARYSVPPGRLAWTDTAIIEPRRAVVGLPTSYRCIESGEYGTGAPPVWSNGSIHGDRESALGAYSTSSEVILAPLGATPSTGGLYSDWARNLLLNYWLRGELATPPAGLKLQLSMYYYNPLDMGYPTLPYVNVKGMFAAAQNNKTTNTSDITFSLSTVSDYEANSVLLLDNGNNLIWESRLARPVPCLMKGPAATMAAGAITASGGLAGGLTDDILTAEANFWHRGVALPTVAGRYLGLSTAPARVDGTAREPVGNGYARVALTTRDFGPASQGRSSLDRPVLFPDPTGADWPTVQSVFIADSLDGGKILWHENLVKPRTARVGQSSLRFDRGSLVIVK